MTPLMLNAHHRLQLAGFTYDQASVYLEVLSEVFEGPASCSD